MFGGALLLTAWSMLLSGVLLPAAVRSIIFGGVLLAAVVALRERTPARGGDDAGIDREGGQNGPGSATDCNRLR